MLAEEADRNPVNTLRTLAVATITAALFTTMAPTTAIAAEPTPGAVAPQSAATASPSIAGPVYDAGGNLVPPPLNAHVDQWCDPASGTSGPRVEMLYLKEASDPDQYAKFTAELREEARYIDDAFAVASAETGTGANTGRRVRWATDPGTCNVTVRRVDLPDGTLGLNASTTTAALKARGILQTNRLYLGFTHDNYGGGTSGSGGMATCGQTSTIIQDDKKVGNKNDGSTIQFARIDHLMPSGGSCHSVNPLHYDSPALHELLHIMGALSPSAPHSGANDTAHCTDGYDAICNPGPNSPALCEAAWVVDCGKDDYFNTNPQPGNYLATHWNLADSVFLAKTAPLPVAPSATLTVSAQRTTDGPVTITANVEAGAIVNWSTDACDVISGTAGTTFTLWCLAESDPTVSARVWRPGQKTVGRTSTKFHVATGASPTVTITGPAQAAPNQQVTLSAAITKAPSTGWTYTWQSAQDGCTFHGPTTGAHVSVACDGTTSTDRAVFFVEAERSGIRAYQPDTYALSITTTAPVGAIALDLYGPASATGGQQVTIAANSEAGAIYQWQSSRADCSIATDPADRSIGYVICPAATYAALNITVAVTSQDGLRSTAKTHALMIYPASDTGPIPPNPPTNPPNPPTNPNTKDTDLSLSATPTGNDVAIAVTLAVKGGATLPFAKVQIEFRPAKGGAYAVVALATTDSTGKVGLVRPATAPGYYRAQFAGDGAYETAVSRESIATAATTLSNAKWSSKGLKATLKTVGGTAIGKGRVKLFQKVGSKWKSVGSYATSSAGVAQVKINPKAKTSYRFTYTASSGYRSSVSAIVTLK